MTRALSLALLLALLPALAFAQAPAAVNGGVYLATPPSLTNKQAAQFQLDSSGNLRTTLGTGTNTIGSVNQGTSPWTVSGHIICDSGCGGSGGTSSNFSAAFPATGTAAGASFGGNMVALTSDGTNLNINCVVGCAGGTFNNNADTVATSATNGQSASWPYVWNGSSWDRLYGDKTNGAFVNVKNASLAVTGTFWQATQPVSGTVAATQSGTWTVQPGNTANTTAWKVDGSAVTQPVSGTFWQATQPVSGTFWQATQPVSGTVAATQSGTWSDRMQDGAGTALTSTGSALDVNLKTSSITLPVAGTFWQATQPVSGTVTANQGGAPWSENLTQVNGTTLSLGQAMMNNSLPVTMAANQSAIPVYQGALSPPWVETLALNGKVVLPGPQPQATSVPVSIATDQPGLPLWSSPGQYVSGAASSTSNSAVTIISARPQGMWITGVQCGRSDAATTAMIVTLSDRSSTILVLPNGGGGGGNNLPLSVPLRVNANTALTFTPGTSVTTSYCAAQGWVG